MTERIRTTPSFHQVSASGDLGPTADAKSEGPKAPSPSEDLLAGARKLADQYAAQASRPTVAHEPPIGWYRDKVASETACLILSCDSALRAAKLEMSDGGLAERMLDHFLSGSAAPVHVDLDAELDRNPQLREYVASRIEFDISKPAKGTQSMTEMTGSVWVPQSAYGSSDAGRDQRLALGGTYFEYKVVGSSPEGGLETAINISDHYFWSPTDANRATQCLHECGASLVSSKLAVEFHQAGEGTIVVNDPSRDRPMMPLDVETQDDS